MVDSKAQRNFISLAIVLKHLLSIKVKDNGYSLVLTDNNIVVNGIIDIETVSLYISITNYSKTI
jgi:hypothetical protein